MQRPVAMLLALVLLAGAPAAAQEDPFRTAPAPVPKPAPQRAAPRAAPIPEPPPVPPAPPQPVGPYDGIYVGKVTFGDVRVSARHHRGGGGCQSGGAVSVVVAAGRARVQQASPDGAGHASYNGFVDASGRLSASAVGLDGVPLTVSATIVQQTMTGQMVREHCTFNFTAAKG